MLEVIIAELEHGNGWQIVVDGTAGPKHAHAYDAYHNAINAMYATMEVAGAPIGALLVTWEIHTELGEIEVNEVQRVTHEQRADASEAN